MRRVLALTVLAVFNSWSAAEADLTTGLVAHYPLDGDAQDVSGNGYDGTGAGGVTFGPGVTGEAALFDGVDDVIEADGAFNLTAFTIATWLRSDAPSGSGTQAVVAHGESTGDRMQYSLLVENDGRIVAWFEDPGDADYQLYSLEPIEADSWTFAAVTRDDDGEYRLYVDGLFNDSALATPAPASVIDHPLTIGARTEGALSLSQQHFAGAVDEVRVYDRALSGEEIRELAGTGPLGSGVFFDDFLYDCIAECPGGRALFGVNTWEASLETTFNQATWGHHGHSALPGTSLRDVLPGNGDGYLYLGLVAGFAGSGEGSQDTQTPLVGLLRSNNDNGVYRFNPGTYMARVLLSDVGNDDQTVQTVWTQSSGGIGNDPLYAEADFEFYQHRPSDELDYVLFETGCEPSESSTDPLVGGSWTDFIVRVSPDSSVEFAVHDAGSGTMLSQWSSPPGSSHVPETGSAMGIFFNIWTVNSTALAATHEMLVDFVVHVPDEILPWTTLSAVVSEFRQESPRRERVDSTALFRDGFEAGDLRYWEGEVADPCP